LTTLLVRTRANAAHDLKLLDDWLKRILRIYGALRLSSPGDWAKAAIELFVTLVFGLLPIWVPLIVFPMFDVAHGDVWDIIYDQIKHGELYFLSTALLAPIFYFTFPGARSAASTEIGQFPSQRVLILIFVLTLVISVLAIAASKLQSEVAGIPPRMVHWSEWLFSLSCVLYFFTLTVKNWFERGGVESIYDEQSREEDRRNPDPERQAEEPAVDPDTLVEQTIAAHVVVEQAPGGAQ
jgi:hypothetical protein